MEFYKYYKDKNEDGTKKDEDAKVRKDSYFQRMNILKEMIRNNQLNLSWDANQMASFTTLNARMNIIFLKTCK